MAIDASRARQNLKDFNLKALFVEELGWERHTATHDITVDGNSYRLGAVAHKRGLAVFICQPGANGLVPDYATRRKIDRQLAKLAHEHVIVFVDSDKTTQIWQWVKKEPGKPVACREHTFHTSQPGDALIQKVQALGVSIDEETSLTLPEVTGRVRAAFDVERVTKHFYDRFKSEHEAFLRFLKGIPDDDMQRWYVSVMLNRLMFIYFIQKKGFLDNNANYLRDKLAQSKKRGKDRFYSDFLCPLFFEGFAKKEAERSAATNQLLGKVPYLNGGLFLKHQIEERYGTHIQIGDTAFEKLFAFFDQYHWHLDERPLKRDDEINPDVLGYIFEKYINQKQMGAYYSKEDITGYISQGSLIPFLFDQARKGCKIAFEGEHCVWRLLQTDPDRYIYDTVKTGVSLKLPPEIAAGLNDVSKRTEWNKAATGEYSLPTELWREVVFRRKRFEKVWGKLAGGEVRAISDLITYNLDIRQFAQDVIESCEGPDLLRAFYKAITTVSVLDPACGSGAFLFAALNILESLYEACLDRMQVFLDELEQSKHKHRPEKFADFKKELERVAAHPNRKYFVYKAIIVNNLFGVDIMEEATEICKLRLFLKLVAQIDRLDQIEPLPDIDFNIRAGNTLVGYVSYEDVKRAVTSKFDFEKTMDRIAEKAQEIDRLFRLFREMQSDQRMESKDFGEAKDELLRRLKALEDELSRYLAGEYGVKSNDRASYERWLASHKPFHWFIEFYGIVAKGGFDVAIENPPYVEYGKVRGEYTIRHYSTEGCGNLFAFFTERSLRLLAGTGKLGIIIPVASVCTDGYAPLQRVLVDEGALTISSYNDRPGKLFDGLEHIRLAIIFCDKNSSGTRCVNTTKYNRWQTIERLTLFTRLAYTESSEFLREGIIPKLSSDLEKNILRKLTSQRRTLNYYARNSSDQKIYYTRKLSGFVQILDFVPEIYDERGRKREPSELKTIGFDSEAVRDVFLALLNSNLFYWLLTVQSDCRNLNKREVLSAPFDAESAKQTVMKQLGHLSQDLMRELQGSAKTLKIGDLKIQCTYPKFSKRLIDQIDGVLATHFGFDAEELDFVINYDIKYRMGDELEEADD
ncbi:MAG: Eco57I restriction-modification methylase domain-containing protein [Candidatus Acidiferrales bacterium]